MNLCTVLFERCFTNKIYYYYNNSVALRPVSWPLVQQMALKHSLGNDVLIQSYVAIILLVDVEVLHQAFVKKVFKVPEVQDKRYILQSTQFSKH